MENDFKLLAQCIRSDQLSARQVQEHLKDKAFRKYYEKHYLNRHEYSSANNNKS